MDLSKSGKRIKEMRKKRGYSGSQLAELCDGYASDSGRSKVSRWEKGIGLDLDNIQRIAAALECDVDYLLGCIDHPDITTSWIAEQIPLSREAVDNLIKLNSALSTNEPHFKEAYSMIVGILNTMIIELTPKYISPNEFGDSTGRKGFDLFNYAYKYHKAAIYLKDHDRSLDPNHTTTMHDHIKSIEMRDTTEAIEIENAQLSMDANAIRIGNILGEIATEYLKSFGFEEA